MGSLARSSFLFFLSFSSQHFSRILFIMTTDLKSQERYYADRKAPICPLVILEHFNSLTDAEKRYAHHISVASWVGARVILEQTTPTASDLFDLIRVIFSASKEKPTELANLDSLKAAATDDDLTAVMEYCAQTLSNLANYKSFGDIKFIPRIPKGAFRAVVAATPRHAEALPLFDKLAEEIYSLTPSQRTLLGYPDDGHVTNYYTADVTKDDIKASQTWCESRGMDPLNTRLFKRTDGVFELKVASANITAAPEQFKIDGGRTLELTYGDFAPEMKGIADELERAIPYAANEHQRKMLEHYVVHFRGGSIVSRYSGQPLINDRTSTRTASASGSVTSAPLSSPTLALLRPTATLPVPVPSLRALLPWSTRR